MNPWLEAVKIVVMGVVVVAAIYLCYSAGYAVGEFRGMMSGVEEGLKMCDRPGRPFQY